MADTSVAITAGSGTPIRVLSGLGAASADQQVVTIADSAGNLLGTAGNPFPMQRLDASATFSIAANATSGGAVTGLNGKSVGTIHVTSMGGGGTLQIQITGDGTNWVNLTGSQVITNAATGAYVASGNITAAGIYQVDASGFAGIRVITTAYTSGTITGIVRASDGVGAVAIEGIPAVTLSGTGTVVNAAGSSLIGATYVGATSQSSISYTSTSGTNAASGKSSAGHLFELSISNPTSTAAYFKLFNKASAPTVGTDVPIATFRVAPTGTAGDTVIINFGANGKWFSLGIAFSITGAAVATDTTSAVAGIQVSATYA